MSSDIHGPIWSKNRLLAKLPEADQARLVPLLRPTKLAFKRVLYEAGGPIDHAYFPLGAVLSALTLMEDGNAIEVATVGNEGVVGATFGGSSRISPNQVIVQIGDGGLRIEAKLLEEEAGRSPRLRHLLADYQTAFLSQVSQSVACNGLHRLEQRCSRWLLMTRDRVGSDELRLTHEYLGVMLGARRASVTDVLRPLQDAGLVSSARGQITILDGKGLEATTCECYRVVRTAYDRLLGPM